MSALATADTIPAPPLDMLPAQCPETGAVIPGTRSFDIRIGWSEYWVRTWPCEGGHGWSARSGQIGGWVQGTCIDAVRAAVEALKANERNEGE